MKRRQFLKNLPSTAAGLAAAAGGLAGCAGRDRSRPNFIVLLLDDLGWDDLSCHGNPHLRTPNIDALAADSVQFSQFAVNPVCAPTRATFLTGRHFLRTGVSHVHGGKDFIHPDETLLSEPFQRAGYATGMWGKWHSGHSDGYYPWQRGFDEAYMARLYRHERSTGLLNGEPVEHEAAADRVIVDYAIDFTRRNRGRPFFAYLPFLTPHTPLAADPETAARIRGRGISENLATLYAMIERADEQIGRLLRELEILDLARNTVVLFFSDNGPAVSNGILSDSDRRRRYLSGLKGHKGNLWENGIKSPLFVRWPGRYSPAAVERFCDAADLFPTLLDIAGIIPSPDGAKLDGRSIKLYLEGETGSLPPKTSFNYANPGWPPTDKPWTPEGVHDEYRPLTPKQVREMQRRSQILSVRRGNYKLLQNPGEDNEGAELCNGYALFDLSKDPRERENLFHEKPELAAELVCDLEKWFEGIKAEKHAFHMPIFRIGNGESRILAKGPKRVSAGLECTFNRIRNWRQGDFAEYHIDVRQAGRYRVTLLKSGRNTGARVRVSAMDSRTEGELPAASQVRLGDLDLGRGTGTLRIAVERSQGIAMDSLEEIRLARMAL